jgi:integrase
MSTPLITVFVRHSPDCKYAGDEFCKRCNCRKHLRWSQNGKQHRKQAGTRSWTEAELVKADLADQLAGRVSEKRATDAKTLTEARDAFLKGKRVKKISPGMLSRHGLETQRLITFCESRRAFTVAGLDLELLTDYKATWPELYPSTNTQHVVQLCLRVFLNYCHQAGWLTKVPKLDPVKIDEPPTTPLTDAEYEKVLGAAKTKRVRAIIQLMRWTGLAVRDAACLRSDALYGGPEVFRVATSRQKTGVHVEVPIPPAVAQDILAGANKGAEHLFYDGNATPINFAKVQGQHISWAFARGGVRCKGHMVSHRLRDTFACHLLSHGVPMEEVSRLLGHTSISTTERHYAQWAKGRQDRVDSLVSATWKPVPTSR